MNTPSLVRPKCYINNVHLHLFFLFSIKTHTSADWCWKLPSTKGSLLCSPALDVRYALEDRRGAEGEVCVCRQNVRVVSMMSCLLPGYPGRRTRMSRKSHRRAEAGRCNSKYRVNGSKHIPFIQIKFTSPPLTLPASAPSPSRPSPISYSPLHPYLNGKTPLHLKL